MISLKRLFGMESSGAKIKRYDVISKSFSEVEQQLDSLSEDFFVEKSLREKRLKDPENEIIKAKIEEKFETFLKDHKDKIKKAKKQFDSLKREKETLEKSPDVKLNKSYHLIKKAYQNNQVSLDAFNQVIKSITKEGKTKYADVILFNEKSEILLLKRSTWDDSNSGAWVLPGGHVDPGESYETAAKRELVEESGYAVTELKNVGSYEDDKCHIEYYSGEIDLEENPLPILQWEEARDARWVKVDDLNEYEMVFNMKENIMRILGIQEAEKKVIRKSTEIIKAELQDLHLEFNVELAKQRKKQEFLLSKGFTDEAAELGEDIEKAVKDYSKLMKIKKLVYREGKLIFGTYYVAAGKTLEEADKTGKAGVVLGDVKQGDFVKVGMKKKNHYIEGQVIGFSFDKKNDAYYIDVLDADGKYNWLYVPSMDSFENLSAGDGGEYETAVIKEPEEEYTVIKSLGGSTGAVLVEDKYGNKYVKKTGKDKEHIDAEHQALLLYKYLGVNVPGIHKYDKEKGELYTEYINGDILANHLDNSYVTNNIKTGFGVDVLLANWDVAGMVNDNIIVSCGIPFRVDVGGSLNKRAQGENKDFGEVVTEMETLLDPNINPQTAKIFEGVPVYITLESVVANYDYMKKIINDNPQISKQNKEAVAARVEYLKGWLQKNSPQFQPSEMGYKGDIFEIPVDEDGESYYDKNIVEFYTQINKDLVFNKLDEELMLSDGLTESYCKLEFVNAYIQDAPIIVEGLKRGVTWQEFYAIRNYTGSAYDQINSLVTKYSSSETGNVNFSNSELHKKTETKTVITKKKETVDLNSKFETILSAIKSHNHAVETSGNVNETKMTAAKNAAAELQKVIKEGKVGDTIITPEQDKKLAAVYGHYTDLMSHYKQGTKTPTINPPSLGYGYITGETEVTETVTISAGNSSKEQIKINGFEYGGSTEKYIPQIKLICSGLKKLEGIKKKEFYREGLFSRGIDVKSSKADKFRQEHSKPNDYVMHQWGSSSSWETKGFVDSRNTYLKIIGDGIHVNDISNHKGSESEVLHKPFTLFKTVSYTENDPNEFKRLVYLKKIL